MVGKYEICLTAPGEQKMDLYVLFLVSLDRYWSILRLLALYSIHHGHLIRNQRVKPRVLISLTLRKFDSIQYYSIDEKLSPSASNVNSWRNDSCWNGDVLIKDKRLSKFVYFKRFIDMR